MLAQRPGRGTYEFVDGLRPTVEVMEAVYTAPVLQTSLKDSGNEMI